MLFTGVTGFVGKVLLEKYLDIIPNIGKMYLLIRSKPKISLEERLTKEIFSSKIFRPLFQRKPELLQVIRERVVPIKGDLVLEGLGIDPKVRAQLTDELDVIINSAASVNFDDPIREALQINFFGAKRILELAHDCKKLLALHHVSTSYVNSNLPNNSVMPEEILPFPEPQWEQLIESINKMDPQTSEREEPLILKRLGFPNTYTLTKNLAEQYIYKHRGPDLRVSISRPAVVTATDKFPFPGWTDSLAAAGAIFYSIGSAISNKIHSYENVTCAQIPCDYVVNSMLVGTAMSAMAPKPDFMLYHVCPSHVTKMTQFEFLKGAGEYVKFQPWDKTVGEYKKLV